MGAMQNVTFDTLAVAEELEESGFAPGQAKALTRAIEAGRAVDLSHLATKQDLQLLKQDLEVLRRDITIKFAWMRFIATGLLLTAMGTATSLIIRTLPR
jgi:hypothetical protein